MKIDILTCAVSRTSGGLLDAIRDLYKNKNLIKEDIEIYSYIDEYTESDLPTWDPLKIKLYKKGPFFYSKKIKNDLLSSKSDLLHVHGLWRYPHAFINSWKTRTRKPVIVTPHGMLDPYIISNQSLIKRILGKYLFADSAFKATDCYHALCKAELEDIRAYGITNPVAIIPNGVNMPDENLSYKRNDNKKHLLFLGRLHPKKGVDLLLEALGKLKEANPETLNNWVLDIVGWSQENFDHLLHNIVEKYSLQDCVKFHGGLFGNEKTQMYATSDAYVLSSHGEGLPMTVLEAWSWGLPVVITPQCNIPEGYEERAAIKIENNIDSIYAGLIDLFSMSDEDRTRIGNNGLELVKKHFTWEASASKMHELYDYIINKTEKPNFVYNS